MHLFACFVHATWAVGIAAVMRAIQTCLYLLYVIDYSVVIFRNSPHFVHRSAAMHLTLSAALLTIVAVCLTTALPDGAPTSVCETLTPSHGGIPGRATASPFSLRTEATAVHQGEKLTVYIDAQPPELMFGGFMLHALNADGLTEVIGSFVPIAGDTETKYITCGSIADSTVTHTHSQPKSAGKAFEWLAPANFVGDVVFRGTVAQKYDTFWVGVESDEVRVVAAGEPLPPGSGGAAPRPTSKPTVAPFPEGQKDPVNELDALDAKPIECLSNLWLFLAPILYDQSVALDPIYNGCGDTKECLGFPRDCAASRSCDSIGTLSILGDRYIFEIRTWISSAAYVALGLSDDDKMGDDAVIECVPEQGTVRAFTSWTSGPPNYGADRQVVVSKIISLVLCSHNLFTYSNKPFERPAAKDHSSAGIELRERIDFLPGRTRCGLHHSGHRNQFAEEEVSSAARHRFQLEADGHRLS